MQTEEQRLDAFERRASELEARLARVESAVGVRVARRAVAAAPDAQPAAKRAVAVPPRERPAPAPAPARPAPAAAPVSLEDLLGGRVLAWVGGAAVLVGIAFFFAIAVSRGWLGEEARCLLGAAGALTLLAVGVRAQRRGAAPEAAVTAVGAGIAALDLDVAVAARAYDLLSPGAGIALVLLVGAAATLLAVRRRSPTIAAFGILGGLLAPALAGATYDGATIALLLAASLPAAAVLVARRWDGIALGAFAVTAPQLGLWLVGHPSTAGVLAALTAFGLVSIAQAVGFELRTAAGALRPVSAFLLIVDALVLAGAGSAVLLAHGDAALAHAWLAGLALAHLAVGLSARRLPRVSRELGLPALAIGVVLVDVTVAATLSGAAVPVAYAVGALAFAALARALPAGKDDNLLVRAGLGGHVLLAAAHALVVDAPVVAMAGGRGTAIDAGAAALALGAVAAASMTAARVDALPRVLRGALDATALAAVAWLAAITLDPVALVLAWAAEGVVLAQLWRRTRDDVAAGASWAHLALAAGVALTTVAPPSALADGLEDPRGAALALGALAIALARAARVGVPLHAGVPAAAGTAADTSARALWPAAALTALFLASALLVTPLAPHAGQAALSALWGAAGVGTLLTGLALDRAMLRRGGLALLLVTVGKAFLVDLATLDSATRAGSFLAVGMLLLGAAFAWQRQRPAGSARRRGAPGPGAPGSGA